MTKIYLTDSQKEKIFLEVAALAGWTNIRKHGDYWRGEHFPCRALMGIPRYTEDLNEVYILEERLIKKDKKAIDTFNQARYSTLHGAYSWHKTALEKCIIFLAVFKEDVLKEMGIPYPHVEGLFHLVEYSYE